MSPTSLGLVGLYAFPLLVLLYDLGLKLTGRPTISDLVWSSTRLKLITCAYLVIACILLVLHLGVGFLDG